MKQLRWSFALVLVLGLVQAASAAPPIPLKFSTMLPYLDNTPLPSAWYGIWNVQEQSKDCQTLAVLSSFAFTDTICPGQDVYSDTTFSCSGSVTSTAFHITCTTNYVDGDCAVAASVTGDGTLSGDTYTSVTIVTYTYSGDNCPLQGTFCSRIEETGTRTSTSTAGCNAPVEPLTWGRLKSVYP